MKNLKKKYNLLEVIRYSLKRIVKDVSESPRKLMYNEVRSESLKNAVSEDIILVLVIQFTIRKNNFSSKIKFNFWGVGGFIFNKSEKKS